MTGDPAGVGLPSSGVQTQTQAAQQDIHTAHGLGL